jgi:hypothetical protein
VSPSATRPAGSSRGESEKERRKKEIKVPTAELPNIRTYARYSHTDITVVVQRPTSRQVGKSYIHCRRGPSGHRLWSWCGSAVDKGSDSSREKKKKKKKKTRRSKRTRQVDRQAPNQNGRRKANAENQPVRVVTRVTRRDIKRQLIVAVRRRRSSITVHRRFSFFFCAVKDPSSGELIRTPGTLTPF